MLHEQIAIALEISTDTLRKYYEHELAVGSTQRRVDVLAAMYRAATTKGSTSAAKVYLANEPQLAAPPVPKAPEVEKAPKLGKKEQAAADATTAAAGTSWDSLLPRPGQALQ